MLEFSTLIALDEDHVKELRVVWPTWKKFKSQILLNPLVILCDNTVSGRKWKDLLSFVDHTDIKLVPVIKMHNDLTQRQFMLSSFVLSGPKSIETKWYLKLDSDVVALNSKKWIIDEWFNKDEQGREPVFATSGWGYTKPANTVEKLDNWADNIVGLKEFPRLNLPYDPNSKAIIHKRIISYVFFGNTEWCRNMAELAGDRLPHPSQDGYLWYCADRRKEYYVKDKMKRYGWSHLSRINKLKEVATLSLRGEYE